MANAGEYLQLPDNSYVQIPSGLDETGKVNFAKQAFTAFNQQLGQGANEYAQKVSDNRAADLAYAQANPNMSLQQAQKARVAQMTANPVTAGQQLREDNNPVIQGLQAAGNSASQGVLGTLAAPGAGLGQAAGTTAQNILGNIPGLGGPAGIIPSAGAALAHAGGTYLGDVATGNVIGSGLSSLLAKAPGALVDAINAVRAKGALGAAKDALPALTKEGQINQLAPKLGQAASFGERVANPVSKDVKALYQIAEAQNPVPTQDLYQYTIDALQKENSMGNPNLLAKKTLKGLSDKFLNNNQLAYSDVLEEAQRLRQTAAGLAQRQPQAATTLNETRQGLLDILDNTSPVAKQAGQLYRKDLLAKDIIETLRGPNPGGKVRTLLEQDPRIAATFGFDTPEKIDAFAKAADKIGVTKTVTTLAKIGGIGGLLSYFAHRKLYGMLAGD